MTLGRSKRGGCPTGRACRADWHAVERRGKRFLGDTGEDRIRNRSCIARRSCRPISGCVRAAGRCQPRSIKGTTKGKSARFDRHRRRTSNGPRVPVPPWESCIVCGVIKFSAVGHRRAASFSAARIRASCESDRPLCRVSPERERQWIDVVGGYKRNGIFRERFLRYIWAQ